MNKTLFTFIIILFFAIQCRINPNNQQLNLIITGDPKSLDPAQSTDIRTGKICALLFDTLVRYGHSTDILPGIAKNWEIINLGKTYIFNLYSDIKFHNGTLLTANHVKSSFERVLNPEKKSPRTWLFDNVLGAKQYRTREREEVSGFEVVNDSTFLVHLKTPFSPFLGFLAMPAASILLIDKTDKPIGTGPWRLIDRMIDGHLFFERNNNYFNGTPKLKHLKIRVLPEALPRTAEFITGYLDIMEIPIAEYELWENDNRWKEQITQQNELNTYYIGLNCSRAPFNNIKVRQALNYAIDKENIILWLFNGKGTPASGPIPPELLGNTTPTYHYDPQRARKMLVEAGYKDGFKVSLWQSQSQENLLITEVIQSQLEKIGVTTTIKQNDWNMFTQAIREGTPDMYYRSWYADYPDAENFLSPLFESEISKARWTRYNNPELDSLIIQLQKETNSKQKNIITQKANRIVTEDAPWIFLWHSQTPYIINPKLKNWYPSVMFNAEKYTDVWKE